MTAVLVPGLDERIAELATELDCLDGRDLAARLQELERIQRRLERAIVGVVGEADRRGVWADDGHRSVRGWCQATVNWSGAETTHRVRSVRLLNDLASVDAALAEGRVGVAQVRELARLRANPRCGDHLVDCEDTLLGDAISLPFDDFRIVTHRWEALADTDGAHRDHEACRATRNVNIDQVGNGFNLNGRGDALTGEMLREILERFADAEFHVDWDEARERLGDDVTPSDLARTAAQRRFDALVAIFLKAAGTEPGTKPPEPVVDIVVDLATFEAAMAAMAEGRPLSDFMPPPTDDDLRSRRCETIHGISVDPCDAAMAALVGHVRRVVFGSRSCVIDLGVATRLFRGAARHAVWLQGTRCLWPGCGRRQHNQADHTVPHSRNGPTAPRNGGPGCLRHNLWKERGYNVWRDPDGVWHVQRPDGTEIRPI